MHPVPSPVASSFDCILFNKLLCSSRPAHKQCPVEAGSDALQMSEGRALEVQRILATALRRDQATGSSLSPRSSLGTLETQVTICRICTDACTLVPWVNCITNTSLLSVVDSAKAGASKAVCHVMHELKCRGAQSLLSNFRACNVLLARKPEQGSCNMHCCCKVYPS